MNEELLKQWVYQLINEQIFTNWKFWIGYIFSTLISLALYHFFTTYISTRAKTFATKADFNEILRQLNLQTEATESIKTSISHSDWTIKENKLLRRQKLEALNECAMELGSELMNDYDSILGKGTENRKYDSKSISKFTMLSWLYFPEIKPQTQKVSSTYHDMNVRLAQLRSDLLGKSMEEHIDIVTENSPEIMNLYRNLITSVRELNEESFSLMQRLINIDQ